MFLLIYIAVNVKTVLLWLECRHEDVWATGRLEGTVNNALFHSDSQINQMPPQITHILRFFLVDSLSQIL